MIERAVIRSLLVFAACATLSSAQAAHPAFQVEVTGKGQPIIFIPGLASSGEVWDNAVTRYCGRHQCHVLTLAGFAGVPPQDDALLPAVQEQLSGYIQSKGLQRPVIVGHSLGGYIALKLAISHPEQVGQLVIVDALPALGAVQMPDISAGQLQNMAAGMRDRLRNQDAASYAASQRRAVSSMATHPSDVERIADWGQRSHRASVADAVYQMMADDLRSDLARITAPTLVLATWIAYRDYVSRADVERSYRTQYGKLAGARIELADNARHFIMYDDPAWMYARMDAFLK